MPFDPLWLFEGILENRRSFLDHAEQEIARSKRTGEVLSVLMFDIDHFKNINDEFGHDVGDEVLVDFTARSVSQLREIDYFGRLGGEEFAAILIGAEKPQAFRTAERIRAVVQANPVCLENDTIVFTVSIGVHLIDLENENIHQALKIADVALYEAKESGRNKIVYA